MTIRKAEPSEAEIVRDLINAAFRPAEEFFVDGDRVGIEEVRERMDRGEFWIADDAGCVYIERAGDRGYLGLLSVSPARQGNGIGKKLVAAAEERCRELGCGAVDLLIVNLRGELPGFYRTLGYRESGTEPFPIDTPTKLPCYFIKMSKEL
jgi:GNAT superfamily N-acetyltransferase